MELERSMDDMELLRVYVANASEEAFETLVGRYTDLVYSTALRQARDVESAKEITQSVFLLLARKAPTISESVRLSGWLFRTTCFVTADVMKAEHRRVQREQKAAESEAQRRDNQTHSVWQQISPMLNELLNQLKETDRTTLLLRFFEGKDLKEVGRTLGITEETAKKRVTRAIEKLRVKFLKKGVILTGAALTEALPLHVVHSAPAGLAATIVSHITASGALITFSSIPVLKGMTLPFLNIMKFKTATTAGAMAMMGSTALYLWISNHELKNENLDLRKNQKSALLAYTDELNRLKSEIDQLPRLRAENMELHKLRNEVRQLREQSRELEGLRNRIGKQTVEQPPPELGDLADAKHQIKLKGAFVNEGVLDLPKYRRIDVLEAIDLMGGLDQTASSLVHIIRASGVTRVRLSDLKAAKDEGQPVWLEPGDELNVPHSFFN